MCPIYILVSVDDTSVRRYERKDLVPRPKTPQFDARSRISEAREYNKQLRHALTDNISTYSWRSGSPTSRNASLMKQQMVNFNGRPSTVPTSMFRNNNNNGNNNQLADRSSLGSRGGGGGRRPATSGGLGKQDVLSVMTDGSGGRPRSRLRAL
jgi:hypothetical protein